MRALEGQMALNLYPENTKTKADYCADCIDWLCKYHGCDRDGITPVVERLYAEFRQGEAFDRARCLRHVCGSRAIEGYELRDAEDVFGQFDHSIDYHTVWDRAYAAVNGFPKNDIPRIIEWDYRQNMPIWRDE